MRAPVVRAERHLEASAKVGGEVDQGA
jgi:hypothetical protein